MQMESTNQTTTLASKERWLTLTLIGITLAVLVAGLSLPIMRVQQLVFWKEDFTVLQGIAALFEEGSYLLGGILFLFSVCFPIFKLFGLLYLWFKPLTIDQRAFALEWLHRLSKWSMLDVFVIALLIVVSKTAAGLKIEPRLGIYLFALAVVGSSLLTSWVMRIVKNEHPLYD